MKALVLLALLSLSLSFRFSQYKRNLYYDSYVFAVQWSNGFCESKGCGGKETVIDRNTMTIHGLWPSLKSGKRLPECGGRQHVKEDGSAIINRMKKVWPSLVKSNPEFWDHEYNKHGACVNDEMGWDRNDYKKYFEFSINVFDQIGFANLIKKAFPYSSGETVTVTYEEMKNAIQEVYNGAVFKMNCNGGYITEFYFYLEKDDFSPSYDSKYPSSCASGKLVFK